MIQPERAGQIETYRDDYGYNRCKKCNDVIAEESIFHNEFHYHNPRYVEKIRKRDQDV